ncbi:hypothetical protein [Kitasatospora purpeofusca]|uniref:Uncharacterized protein n=1 Tax=Kitasatospora purpeofusca TaxID=67352 RepID=A0ABZ1TXH2_9ACTN|nr:hypothetical protein [Kitasatospora purpeofusca]
MIDYTAPLWQIRPEERRDFLHARARALAAEGVHPWRLMRASDAAHTADFREARPPEET